MTLAKKEKRLDLKLTAMTSASKASICHLLPDPNTPALLNNILNWIDAIKHSDLYHQKIVTLEPLKLNDEIDTNLFDDINIEFCASVSELKKLFQESDLSLIHWQNHPLIAELLMTGLPAGRYAVRLHFDHNKATSCFSADHFNLFDFIFTSTPQALEDGFSVCSSSVNKVNLINQSSAKVKNFSLDFEQEVLKLSIIKSQKPVNIKQEALIQELSGIFNIELIELDEKLVASISSPSVEESIIKQLNNLRHATNIILYLTEDNTSMLPAFGAMLAGIPHIMPSNNTTQHYLINGSNGFLYHNLAELKEQLISLNMDRQELSRISNNCFSLSKQLFSSHANARLLLNSLQTIFKNPKQLRFWKIERNISLLDTTVTEEHVLDPNETHDSGAYLFIESMGNEGKIYENSIKALNPEQFVVSDAEIALHDNSALLHLYSKYYPKDPFLLFWTGLQYLDIEYFSKAMHLFDSAIKEGFPHWRVYYYHAKAAFQLGQSDVAKESLEKVRVFIPKFSAAEELAKQL